MTKKYRIVFVGWDNPNKVDLTGYNAWDYLPPGAETEVFASEERALYYERTEHLGPDEYCVMALFSIDVNPAEDGLKMKYCTQNDYDCSICSLVNYGRDCRNNPVDPDMAAALRSVARMQCENAEGCRSCSEESCAIRRQKRDYPGPSLPKSNYEGNY